MKKRFNTIKKKSFYPEEVKTVPEGLKKLIGKEIIRIGPTKNGDWSYSGTPVLFEGFTSDNKMKIKSIKEYSIVFFNEETRELPLCFTDDKWILLEDALKAEDNKLNKLIGKKIKRIRPVYNVRFFHGRMLAFDEYKEDCSYMCKYGAIPPTLVSASKYHMVVKDHDAGGNEKLVIIGPRYSNPKDWVEVRK